MYKCYFVKYNMGDKVCHPVSVPEKGEVSERGYCLWEASSCPPIPDKKHQASVQCGNSGCNSGDQQRVIIFGVCEMCRKKLHIIGKYAG